eukprot:3451927-Alexandrium_andersonii.AAC.1
MRVLSAGSARCQNFNVASHPLCLRRAGLKELRMPVLSAGNARCLNFFVASAPPACRTEGIAHMLSAMNARCWN